MTNTAAVTAEIIWDRDHGPENEGYYVRLHRADGQQEDIPLDAATADAARAEVESMYPGVEITRCDESPGGAVNTIPIEQINSSGIQEWARDLGAKEAIEIERSTEHGGATLYALLCPDGRRVMALNTNGEPIGEEDEGWTKTLEYYGLETR